MPKLTRLAYAMMMVLLLACGSMTIRIDTEVSDETEVKHDFHIEASGQMALLLADSIEFDDIADSEVDCSMNIDTANEIFELRCMDVSHSDIDEVQVDGEGIYLQVSKKDLGDQWEYRADMGNIFFDADEELKDNPLASGENLDAIIKLRFHWTVQMPGEVHMTNADIYERGTATFTARLGDERDVFYVVSRQDKGGSCN